MSEITKPADIQIDEITIDGVDIIALTTGIEIFENIFMSAVCGSLTIMDSDGASFVEDNKIEFNEPFKFTITGAGDSNRMVFDGVLNGLRGESTNKGNKVYVIDFTTAELRKNEESFITKRFNNEKTEDIINYCLSDKLGATEIDIQNIKGQPMEFLGSRRKPFWVIKYALTHGVIKPEAGDGQNTNKEEKDVKNNTGFLCWQTLSETGTNAYRGCDLDTLLQGGFEEHGPYDYRAMNTGLSMAAMMKSIVSYDFQTMGNIQDRMKSGAFKSRIVSYDMDTGLHKEFNHDADAEMTEKQRQIVTKNTRYMFKPFTNDKFATGCEKAQPNTGDQSRDFLAQNNSRQNTFNDQSGTASLYPNFMVHAGDIVDFSINKTKSGSSSNMKHEKHSGKYVVKQVAHVLEVGGKSYTQVSLLRSTNSEETQK